jgi:tRNA dimethylallyltransferase
MYSLYSGLRLIGVLEYDLCRMSNILAIVGCTASGKSDLAENLALRWSDSSGNPTTIMAVDSMQVYRGMDIGTAKPTPAMRTRLPHVMIDLADPWEAYSAAKFAQTAMPIIRLHQEQHRPLILVVGTILYLRALLEGLFEGPAADPEIRQRLRRQAEEYGAAPLHEKLLQVDPAAAGHIHPNDLRRIIRALEVYELTGTPISRLQIQWQSSTQQFDCRIVGIAREKEDINHRINQRVKVMMEMGLLEEVQRLYKSPNGLSVQAAQAVGYKEIIEHLCGKISLDQSLEQIKIQTRHLAKLQRTWLKRFDSIQWFHLEPGENTTDLVDVVKEQILDSVTLSHCNDVIRGDACP